MLTFEEAKEIGINACIDKLGRRFVEKHRNLSNSVCFNRGAYVFCFAGVNDYPDEPVMTDKLVPTPYGFFRIL